MNYFEFTNYRALIRNLIKSRGIKGRGEISKIADFLGVHQSLISQILGEQKELSSEQTLNLAKYFGLNSHERDYFLLLVQKERAGTLALKQYFEEKIKGLRTEVLNLSTRIGKYKALTDTERAIFYSSWLFSAVRLSCSIKDGKTAEELAQEFSLKREKIKDILDFLCQSGLCEEKNSHYLMKTQHTHVEFGSPFLARHHHNWRSKAIIKSESLEKEELMVTAPMSISRKDFDAIRESLAKSLKGIFDAAKNSDPEIVACLNIDFFFVAK